MGTKERIVHTAIHCFNDKGFGAVSLNDIAKSMAVSRGHIAYHFKDKIELLKYIANDMWSALELERAKSLSFPSFENLTQLMAVMIKYYDKYSFIFMDMQVSGHPVIQPMMEEKCKQAIQDNMRTISFAMELGNMKPEPFKGAYYNLSVQFWMIAFFWHHQTHFRGEANSENMMQLGWSLLLPHFTEKGVESFINYFGKEYYDTLGQGEMEIDVFNI